DRDHALRRHAGGTGYGSTAAEAARGGRSPISEGAGRDPLSEGIGSRSKRADAYPTMATLELVPSKSAPASSRAWASSSELIPPDAFTFMRPLDSRTRFATSLGVASPPPFPLEFFR